MSSARGEEFLTLQRLYQWIRLPFFYKERHAVEALPTVPVKRRAPLRDHKMKLNIADRYRDEDNDDDSSGDSEEDDIFVYKDIMSDSSGDEDSAFNTDIESDSEADWDTDSDYYFGYIDSDYSDMSTDSDTDSGFSSD
ncbi:uncharacterized protein Dana_GF16014 [Drosophila ananassae]|uniref:Uncharacterized protein n=1 Tax=Drosophila ananassae TaxID=7217 RepID=B3N173_DROAN|nr:fibrinogen-binding protein [Drosophila ananassae]EDV30108.1 uncharacterized protein Dana_GF16014 [Drosophila ananassae]